MTHGIKLCLQTKHALIETGVLLTADLHVELAYRMVEAGMFSTQGRKHWFFVVGPRNEADAMLPMYRKVQKGGVERYVPRIPASSVRNSFSALLIALEGLADRAEMAREAAPKMSEEEEFAVKRLAEIVEADKAGAVSENSVVDSNAHASDEGESRRPEVFTLSDGSQIEILEWEEATPAEVQRALGVAEENYGGTCVSTSDSASGL